MNRHSSLGLVLVVLLAASCTPLSEAPPASATPVPAAGLPNPASVFCKEQGFTLELRTDAAGNQSGICHFPDGSECDEWAFYRGECGPAGQTASETAPAPDAVATATPSPETKTYTSAALGISFSYLPEQDGQTIKVLEQGDKIYVYPVHMEPTAGQWVQVFPKLADESLVAAIGRVIMPGYPSQDCLVRDTTDRHSAGSQASDYQYAAISVRRAPGEDDAAVLPRWRTCPQPYTVVGGIGYFQADAQHPNRFLFLSIGQYTILAGPEQPWQETIRFELNRHYRE